MFLLRCIFFSLILAQVYSLSGQSQYLRVFEGDSTKEYKVVYKSRDSLSGVLRAYYAFDSSKTAFIKHFFNGRQSGVYKSFYPNGRLMIFSVFQNGKKNGDWTFYDTSGAVIIKGKYKNGIKDGFWINRKERFQGKYKNGLKNGKWEYNLGRKNYYKKYFSNGKEREKQFLSFLQGFNDKNLVVDSSYSKAEKRRELPYIDSIKLNYKGKEKFYKIRYIDDDSIAHPSMQKAVYVDYPNQTAIIKYVYNGSLNGIYKEYYPNGKVYLYKNYDYGQLDGDWKKYDENGSLIIKGKYKDNMKHGKWHINIGKDDYREERYKKGVIK